MIYNVTKQYVTIWKYDFDKSIVQRKKDGSISIISNSISACI